MERSPILFSCRIRRICRRTRRRIRFDCFQSAFLYRRLQIENATKRDLARFADAMPFEDLVEAAALLLSENGVFAVIIPFKEEENFMALAKEYDLFPLKITRVKGTPTTEIKRSLLAFSRTELDNFPVDELIIETARHIYTAEYIELTKDFYLKM